MSNVLETSTQLVSTINKRYIPGAIAFLKSLKKYNNINLLYNFYLFEELSNEEKKLLTDIYPNIRFLKIDNTRYNYYNTSDKFRNWGFNCYNRFEVFTTPCDKLIFLDLDMIALGSIDELINFNGRFAAIEAPKEGRMDHTTEKFFDGGVFVVSREFLNTETRDSLIEISKIKKWSSDEPVLNLFFEKSITWLPKRYNVLSFEYPKHKNDTTILQYVGSKKPWYSTNLDENYDDYVKHKIKRNDLLKIQKLFDTFHQPTNSF
jgi:lipopolysaccharide biosynthesis glycosyltransferase